MKNVVNPHGRQNGGSRGDHIKLDNTVFYDRKKLRGEKVLHNGKTYEVSRLKVIKSKDTIEVYDYEKPVILNQPHFKTKLDKPLDELPPELRAKIEKEKQSRKAEYKKRSAINAINNIRRLVDCNFNSKSKFVTLTFADTNKIDIRDIKQTHGVFKRFIQRLKTYFPKLKYVAIPEFQDKKQRGAIHYHMISNLLYTPNETLAKIWRYGFVNIKSIEHVSNIGAYLAKYLAKDIDDNRFGSAKKVLRSKYLEHPQVEYSKNALKIINKYNLRNRQPIYVKKYKSEMHGGNISISLFDLKNPILPTKDSND